MTAPIYNFTIMQGSTFQRIITKKDASGTPVNLTGYTARMQARNDLNSAVVLDLTTENGGIVLGGVAGTIELNITATATASLIAPNTLIYDLELVNGAVVNRQLQGEIRVSAEVTR